MSVFGKEELVEHDIDELSKEIGILGRHLKQAGVKKVAIYLPNSVEYLFTIFGKHHLDLLRRMILTLPTSCIVLRHHTHPLALQHLPPENI